MCVRSQPGFLLALLCSALFSLATAPTAPAKRLALRRVQRYRGGSDAAEGGMAGSEGGSPPGTEEDECVLDIGAAENSMSPAERSDEATVAVTVTEATEENKTDEAESAAREGQSSNTNPQHRSLQAEQSPRVVTIDELEQQLEDCRASEPVASVAELSPTQRRAMQLFVSNALARERSAQRKAEKTQQRAEKWAATRRRASEWRAYGFAAVKKALAPKILTALLLATVAASCVGAVMMSVEFYNSSSNPCDAGKDRTTRRGIQHCYLSDGDIDAKCSHLGDLREKIDCVSEASRAIPYPPIYTPYARADLGATIYLHSLPLLLPVLLARGKKGKSGGLVFIAGLAAVLVKIVEGAFVLEHYDTVKWDSNYTLAVGNMSWTLMNLLFVPIALCYVLDIRSWGSKLPGGVRPEPVAKEVPQVTHAVTIPHIDGTREEVEVKVDWNKGLHVRDVRAQLAENLRAKRGPAAAFPNNTTLREDLQVLDATAFFQQGGEEECQDDFQLAPALKRKPKRNTAEEDAADEDDIAAWSDAALVEAFDRCGQECGDKIGKNQRLRTALPSREANQARSEAKSETSEASSPGGRKAVADGVGDGNSDVKEDGNGAIELFALPRVTQE